MDTIFDFENTDDAAENEKQIEEAIRRRNEEARIRCKVDRQIQVHHLHHTRGIMNTG